MGEGIPQWLWILGASLLILAFVAGWILAMRARRSRNQGNTPVAPISLFAYNPINVGNDSAARPWENYPATFELPDEKTRGQLHRPPLCKTKDLEEELRGLFFQLQQAWDRADIEQLQTMLGAEMPEAVQQQLTQRQEWLSSVRDTNIIVLEAHVLHSKEQADGLRSATVEFSGVVRATAAVASSAPFREIWEVYEQHNSTNGKSWLVRAVQSFH